MLRLYGCTALCARLWNRPGKGGRWPMGQTDDGAMKLRFRLRAEILI
ncbi:MAG: hypothetical protein M3Q29_22150 [Chloroflexota bacterium]|nr:hypothetical protein [Chloroflexota bacterium]